MTESPTRQTPSGAVVVAPSGRLTVSVAPALREQLHALVRKGNSRLVVDLSGVDTIDSAALGVLISGLKAARMAGGDLRIAAPGEQVTKVLELTKLHRVLEPCVSADSAFDSES